MKNFMHTLKKHGVFIKLVTARRDDDRGEMYNETVNEMKGIPYDELELKPRRYESNASHKYKHAARDKLIKQGYTILVNIGDQLSDIVHRKNWGTVCNLMQQMRLKKNRRQKFKLSTEHNIAHHMRSIRKPIVFTNLEPHVLFSVKLQNKDFTTI